MTSCFKLCSKNVKQVSNKKAFYTISTFFFHEDYLLENYCITKLRKVFLKYKMIKILNFPNLKKFDYF